MAAAAALQAAGVAVTLLESRRELGGRASSFTDPVTGEAIDNCQHVLLGCCTNLLDLYDRLNVRHLIQFEPTIRFVGPHGKRYGLTRTPGVPAPSHLSISFAAFGILTLPEKIAYARAMLAMLRLGRKGRAKLADVPFGQWLDEHGQPESLVRKMYDPVLIGALNEDCRKASATYAIQVFQDAMLAHAKGYIVGTRVDGLAFEGRNVTGVRLAGGEVLSADVVVLATNHHAVRRWIPDDLAAADARFHGLDQIQSVPILGVHLVFDKPVLAESHVALLDGPLQWLFKKDAEGRVIAGVISAARDWERKPKEESLAQFEHQVRSALKTDAKLVRGTIVVERRATFAPLPGIDRLRPQQGPPAGGIENLFLAGDYTLTGWPATMEGAVRGGYLAADAVLKRVGVRHASFLVPDLTAQWPARMMGLGR
jgi:zeta-carotene desaturase